MSEKLEHMIVVRIGWWYNGEKVSKNKNLWKVGVKDGKNNTLSALQINN